MSYWRVPSEKSTGHVSVVRYKNFSVCDAFATFIDKVFLCRAL